MSTAPLAMMSPTLTFLLFLLTCPPRARSCRPDPSSVPPARSGLYWPMSCRSTCLPVLVHPLIRCPRSLSFALVPVFAYSASLVLVRTGLALLALGSRSFVLTFPRLRSSALVCARSPLFMLVRLRPTSLVLTCTWMQAFWCMWWHLSMHLLGKPIRTCYLCSLFCLLPGCSYPPPALLPSLQTENLTSFRGHARCLVSGGGAGGTC